MNYRIKNDKLILIMEDWEQAFDPISAQKLKEVLELYQEQLGQKRYFLWEGSNGTILSRLTHFEELPSITIGGTGKREKFTPISQAFLKDVNGMFYKEGSRK